MASPSLAGAIARARIRSIKFKWFFRTLELTLDNTSTDPFEALAELRSTHKGNLQLTAAEEGCPGHENPIHYRDISAALSQAERDYRQLEEDDWDAPDGVNVWGSRRAAAIWRHEVPVCAGTAHEYTLAVGDLWVNEADFAAACGRLGLTAYQWPRVPWPQQRNDIEERPIVGTEGAPSSASDASLGAYHRGQLQNFANKNKERSEARQAEWRRWRNEAQRIQSGRTRKASKQELAGLIKQALNLPDSIETIRKRI